MSHKDYLEKLLDGAGMEWQPLGWTAKKHWRAAAAWLR